MPIDIASPVGLRKAESKRFFQQRPVIERKYSWKEQVRALRDGWTGLAIRTARISLTWEVGAE